MKAFSLPLGLLVASIGRSVRQMVAVQVEPLGLSIQEFWALVAVAEHPTASQAELSARRHVDEATTCRVVRTLGEAGLLTAGRDPQDRRRVRLELTPAGAALARRLVPLAREIRVVVESALSPEEREATRTALGKILARLEAVTASAAAPATAPLPITRRPARSATRRPAARAAGGGRTPAPRGSP